MVGEAMCLYDGSQWCSVCGEEEGSKNRALGNPSDQLCALDTSPQATLKDQWDRIQTSEVESQWCPVIRGSGGSDDWQCQKRQRDPAEWGLMIWISFCNHRASVTESSAVSVEWPHLNPDWLASSLLLWKKQWDLVEDNSFECFWLWMEGERQVCKLSVREVFNVVFLSSGVTRACLNELGEGAC